MADWLDDLQEAQRRIRGVEHALWAKMEGLALAGIGKELREDLAYYAEQLRTIEILVSRSTSAAVKETYDSARASSYNMLSALLMFAEAGCGCGKGEEDDNT